MAFDTQTQTVGTAKKRLAGSLAQQSSNQDPAVQQAQQFAQSPNFQPTFPAENNSPLDPASSGEGNQTVGQGISESGAPTSGDPKTPTYTNQGLPPMVAQYPVAAPIAASTTGSTPASGSAPVASSSSPGTAEALALQIVQQMHGLTTPNTAGAKETAKEGLLSQQQQMIEQLRQSAASRGLSGGWEAGQEADVMSQLGPNLTGAYRSIDQQDNQEQFARLLDTLGGAQGLAGLDLNRQQLALQGELGRGQLGISQQGIGLQGQSLDLQRAQAEQNAQLQFLQMLYGLMG